LGRFAFMIHPLTTEDVARKFPWARRLPAGLVEAGLRLLPPMKLATIRGLRSPHGEAEGWFVSCPLTARQMMTLPTSYVVDKIVASGRLAEKLGAQILGLGAFTKVVADAGRTIAERLNIPVTTGNSYTVATALEGTREASRLMGHDLGEAQVVVVGATGAIGRVCAEVLAREVKYLTLVARERSRLEGLAQHLLQETGLAVRISSDIREALADADVVITVTSALETVIEPEYLKPGAVVCDVARPRDVSRRVVELRDDVLVIEGGIVRVPEGATWKFNFGFPPGLVYACMAETMVLAMEERFESFTLGRELTVAQVREVAELARKHGFTLAGFRGFERPITMEEIERIRERAARRLRGRT
jgi:predicted amino acid dehydrogenase